MSAKDKLVHVNGHVYTLQRVAQVFQIPWSTVRQRYFQGERGYDLIRPAKRVTVTIDGKEYTLGKLAIHYRLNPSTVKSRYYAGKRGKDLIQAPFVIRRRHGNRYSDQMVGLHGNSYTLRSLSKCYGIKLSTIRGRFYHGDRGNDLVRPLNTSIRPSRPAIHVEVHGKRRTFQELSRLYHLSVVTIHDRYYQGKQGVELVRPLERHFTNVKDSSIN